MTVNRIYNRWIQDGNTGRRAGSQRHVTSPESRIGIDCKTTSVYTNNLTPFVVAWTLPLETMAAATLDAASQTGASSMFNDQPGCTSDETPFFPMNPGSFYGIKMVASVIDGIVVKAHWQRAFVIFILVHHLA
ncbi:hypothetical protein TNCV_2161161 [Trichonephila clavipes]|nr:hypothetical protein TNCV_2161161 [Trichonephila clavipes]